MIQNVLRAIGGIENYGIISIGLFFLVFLGAICCAWFTKQSVVESMSTLPLQDDEAHTPRKGDHE